jgi:hypothetical protein
MLPPSPDRHLYSAFQGQTALLFFPRGGDDAELGLGGRDTLAVTSIRWRRCARSLGTRLCLVASRTSSGPIARRDAAILTPCIPIPARLPGTRHPDPFGAEIGFLAVLHTWGRTLLHHPHLHCVVPGGGLSPDGTRWIACRPGFFLPVRVLSRLFRRLFLAAVQHAFEDGHLRFSGALQGLSDPRAFAAHLQPVGQTEWVVYAKPPFAGPHQVLDYVGRYTHRVAIANQRRRLTPGLSRLSWRTHAQDGGAAARTPPPGVRRHLMSLTRAVHAGVIRGRGGRHGRPVARALVTRPAHRAQGAAASLADPGRRPPSPAPARPAPTAGSHPTPSPTPASMQSP